MRCIRPIIFLFVTIVASCTTQERGHADSAIVYYEKFGAYKDPNLSEDSQFLPGSYKRLGELYEAKGNRRDALSHYNTFLTLWKDADPELQPKVQEVRQRVSRLSKSS